ncbi:MAG: TatD family hydrolase, partial [Rhodospirillaceae bacterium]
IWCTVGIHPHEAENEPETGAQRLMAMAAASPKVVGFGETGLDYFYEHSPREAQKRAFLAHIEASRQTGLPIIIHTRDADDDTMAILEEEQAKGAFPGLIHCFSSSKAVADLAVKLGMYVSMSGILTFPKAQNVRDAIVDVPLEHLLVETDAPYLSPVPKRGKRNEPAHTAHTLNRLAEERGIPAAEVARQTTENFFKLFQKADIRALDDAA